MNTDTDDALLPIAAAVSNVLSVSAADVTITVESSTALGVDVRVHAGDSSESIGGGGFSGGGAGEDALVNTMATIIGSASFLDSLSTSLTASGADLTIVAVSEVRMEVVTILAPSPPPPGSPPFSPPPVGPALVVSSSSAGGLPAGHESHGSVDDQGLLYALVVGTIAAITLLLCIPGAVCFAISHYRKLRHVKIDPKHLMAIVPSETPGLADAASQASGANDEVRDSIRGRTEGARDVLAPAPAIDCSANVTGMAGSLVVVDGLTSPRGRVTLTL